MPSFLPGADVSVEQLGIHSSECVWMGKSMSEAQSNEAIRAGLTLGQSEDVIYTGDGVWASASALGAFRRASDTFDGPVVGCISGSMTQWAEHPAFGPPARLYRNIRPDDPRVADCPHIPFDIVNARTIEVPSGDVAGGRLIQIPISDALLVSTHHWSGVLWANLLSLPEVPVGSPCGWCSEYGLETPVGMAENALLTPWCWPAH